MSLSLIGIILVQLYWVNSSLKSSNEQFKLHILHILATVNDKLQDQETTKFQKLYNKLKDSAGRSPIKADLVPYLYKGNNDNKNIIYSDSIPDKLYYKFIESSLEEDKNNFNSQFPDNGMTIDEVLRQNKALKKEFEKGITLYDKINSDFLLRFYNEDRPIENRISQKKLEYFLRTELKLSGVGTTPFEYAIYNNGLITKIKSKNFKYDRSLTYDASIFTHNEGKSRYRLLVSFPEKETFLFLSLLGITSLSIVFTLIIIIAYLSAIGQLIKQKQISEIKTDFINNMTHEFKTPIATINLALDAIKNPKIFSDGEKVQRYLQMIREENKRMHSQVENVLQISRLDKKELDIVKDQADIHDIIEEAIAHVHLIIEDRQGKLTRHFHAKRTTALLNDVHFTNVLVNILDNAIKYSPDEPIIDIYTENIKDFILIKITDKGLGMTKNIQKRIFEKFYREHTGDIHNVKGHGLGLAYVKRIIDDHNCHIYVESEKGKGSTFVIKMPLIN
jgi:two-component system phosphate regulon sensor histidine kinase PhoR